MSSFSGKLSGKKKEELSAIAAALGLPSEGLRDAVLRSIKLHLADNEEVLSADPRFSGLIAGRRRKATSPNPLAQADPTSGEEDEDDLTPIIAPRRSSRRLATAPESIPLPPSAPDTPAGVRLMEALLEEKETGEVEQLAVIEPLTPNGADTLVAATENGAVALRGPPFYEAYMPYLSRDNIRDFLSDSNTIAYLTMFMELTWFLSTVVPFSRYAVPVPPVLRSATPTTADPAAPPPPSTMDLYIPQPSLQTFNHVVYWALPTLIVPYVVASFVSFALPKKEYDPLTAAIVRMGAVWMAGDAGGVPVSTRMAGAAVSLAFAFSQAIFEAADARNIV